VAAGNWWEWSEPVGQDKELKLAQTQKNNLYCGFGARRHKPGVAWFGEEYILHTVGHIRNIVQFSKSFDKSGWSLYIS
jgi:hypothetical protein